MGTALPRPCWPLPQPDCSPPPATMTRFCFERSADGSPAVPAAPEEVRATAWTSVFRGIPRTHEFLTLFYGILNLKTLELRYVSAGHPHAVL